MSGFQRTDIIKGVNFFVGDVDGENYDNGKIFIEEPISESRGTSKGFRTVDYKTVDSNVVRPLMHLEFPITAEVAYDIKTNAKGMPMMLVTQIKPVGRAAPQPNAKTA